MLTQPHLTALIITYRPDPSLLNRLLLALAPQVTQGRVIHNGSAVDFPASVVLPVGFSCDYLGDNLGIATALNHGCTWAEAEGADYILTFDQDSEPAPDMVAVLLAAYDDLTATGQRVGAVGPVQADRRTGKLSHFLAPIHGARHWVQPTVGTCVEVDHLITSGCLFPLAAWQNNGRFLDALFINYVDTEWSLRLRSHGWQLYGVGSARLLHAIGDEVVKWRGQEIAMHSPLRHYFLLRNGVYLQTLPYISAAWKRSDALQLLKKWVFFSLVGRPRWAHFGMMLRGILDGLKGRLGGAPR